MKITIMNWQFWFRLILIFAIPYILLSIVMNLAADNLDNFLNGQAEKPRVGLVGKENMPIELLANLQADVNLIEQKDEGSLYLLIEEDSLDAGLFFPKDFYVDSLFLNPITVYYNSIQNGKSANIVFDILENYEMEIVKENTIALNLETSLLNPIQINEKNTFSPLLLVGKIMTKVKGIIANVFNLLIILLITWLIRHLILKAKEEEEKISFWKILLITFSCSVIGVLLVYFAFQGGIAIERKGMINSVILSIQQMVTAESVFNLVGIWIVTWGFIIGLLLLITNSSKTLHKAHSRTFWAVVLIHLLAFVGMIPIQEMGIGLACVPVVNLFSIGQLTLNGLLDNSMLYTAVGVTLLYGGGLLFAANKTAKR